MDVQTEGPRGDRTVTRHTMTLDSINCSFTNAFSIPVLGFTDNPISLFIHTYCVHGMEFGTRDPKKVGLSFFSLTAPVLHFPTVPSGLVRLWPRLDLSLEGRRGLCPTAL